MKKIILLIAGLIMVSAPAFASRARLESLGEGKSGSYFISDQRNMFLNPAQISSYKKSLALEYGNGSSVADSTVVPKSQGTFINTFGDFTYGITLGNESDATQNLIDGVNTALTANFVKPDNYAELTVAGDAGVKWGVSLIYAGNLNKTAALTRNASQLATRIGLSMDSLQFFGTIALASKATGATTVLSGATNDATNAWKGNLGLDLGVTYAMDDFTFFGNVAMSGFSVDISTDTTTGVEKALDFKTSVYTVGAGYQKEMTKGVKAFSKLAISLSSDETKQSSTPGVIGGTMAVSANNKGYNVPLTFGVEAEALSWLVLRGSVAQSLIGQTSSGFSNTKSNLADTTTVALGTGFTFGSVGIDALAANNANMAGGNTAGGFGFGTNMLYRLAMNVKF